MTHDSNHRPLLWATIAIGCSVVACSAGASGTTQEDGGSDDGDSGGVASLPEAGIYDGATGDADGGKARPGDAGEGDAGHVDGGHGEAGHGGVAATRARAFTGTLGVEIHLDNAGTPYGTLSTVESALSYLNPDGIGTGISTVRDETLASGAGLTDLAALGYQLDIYAWYASPGSNSWSQQAPWMQSLDATGALRMLEGPLEVDNQGWGIAVHSTTYTSASGTTYSGWQAPVAWQQDLFAAYSGKTDVTLFSLADPSDGAGNSPAVAAASQLGTSLPKIASTGNVHYYPPNGYSPGDGQGDAISNVIQQETGYTPGLPFAITECGFTSIAGEGYQGNSYVDGVYTLDLVLDAFRAGASLVSIYELFDESAIYPGSAEGGFGMFDANASAKGAATFMHNMLTVLGDAGSTATSFSPGNLAYEVAGLASPGQDLLLQKSSGAFEVVLWSDASIFVGGTQTTAPSQNVTVSLGGSFATVNLYDPTQGSAPVSTLSNVASVSLVITDAPQIVEVIP